MAVAAVSTDQLKRFVRRRFWRDWDRVDKRLEVLEHFKRLEGLAADLCEADRNRYLEIDSTWGAIECEIARIVFVSGVEMGILLAEMFGRGATSRIPAMVTEALQEGGSDVGDDDEEDAATGRCVLSVTE